MQTHIHYHVLVTILKYLGWQYPDSCPTNTTGEEHWEH